jgi:uncharacterized OsmC-like protein
MNNVNREGIQIFAKEVEQDPSVAQKEKVVSGSWNFEEGNPQYEASVEFPTGSATFRSDQAPFMGGSGLAPDPVQYCLYGISSCYAGTLATIAAMEGVELKNLKVTAKNRINLQKALGLSEEPIIQGVTITVEAEPVDGVSLEEVKRVAALAEERCPGMECMKREIPHTIEVVTG